MTAIERLEPVNRGDGWAGPFSSTRAGVTDKLRLCYSRRMSRKLNLLILCARIGFNPPSR
jgi:hypothetical protein